MVSFLTIRVVGTSLTRFKMPPSWRQRIFLPARRAVKDPAPVLFVIVVEASTPEHMVVAVPRGVRISGAAGGPPGILGRVSNRHGKTADDSQQNQHILGKS